MVRGGIFYPTFFIGGMMSKIEIINRALLKIGEPPIASLNDVAFGQSYDMIYEDIKKLLLSTYPWRFAVQRKILARCAEQFGMRYKYHLPNNCLLLISVIGMVSTMTTDVHLTALQHYEIADNAIVCDESNGIEIEYVADVEESCFPPLFRETLIAKIASEISMRLKHSINFKQIFDNEFFNLIRQAELNNEIIKNAEILPDSSWVSVRQTW